MAVGPRKNQAECYLYLQMMYIVPTPIGNLKDITLRGLEILKTVDIILAEDTRTSKKLLIHYQIETSIRAYHAHNEHKILDGIISDLQSGKDIALISDAGTPGLSDPGFLLIRACLEKEIAFTVLPGANALVPAIVGSGLPNHHFHFEGFLPHKKGRKTRLEYLAQLPDTFIIFESPHRIQRTIRELSQYCGEDRSITLVREISKKFEQFLSMTLSELHIYMEEHPVRGEIVLVVNGIQNRP